MSSPNVLIGDLKKLEKLFCIHINKQEKWCIVHRSNE